MMRPRALWFQVVAVIVEQAVVLLVPAFCVWWAMLGLGCSHAIAAFLALTAGLIVWAAIWSAAEIADLSE